MKAGREKRDMAPVHPAGHTHNHTSALNICNSADQVVCTERQTFGARGEASFEVAWL